jgi:uncharacterized protein (DUF4415 family)
MREKGITRVSRAELHKHRKGQTDWEYLDRVTDEEIAAAVANDPDAVPVDFDWSGAKVYWPRHKRAVSIRLDQDVIDFFKAKGRGYQTRINAVLRSYMEHEEKKRRKKRA